MNTATRPTISSAQSCDTDLFPSVATPAAAPARVASAQAIESVLRTEELKIAVALIVGEFGDPEINTIGLTKNNEPKVEFVFALPAGVTAREVMDRYYRKKFVGEVGTIFDITRALKRRIQNAN